MSLFGLKAPRHEAAQYVYECGPEILDPLRLRQGFYRELIA